MTDYELIDWANPLSGHDLNRGLVFAPIIGGPGWRSNRLIDASASRNHGTLVNGVRWSAGARPALSFDGTDDYVRVADAAGLRLQGTWTVAVWVRPRLLKNYGNVLFKAPFAINSGFGIITSSSGMWNWQSHTGTWGDVAGSTLTTGHDYILTITYDGTSVRTYTNAALISTVAKPAITPNALPLDIGEDTSRSRNFDGHIADPRIYNRALCASDVRQLYQQGLLGNPDLYRQIKRRRAGFTADVVSAWWWRQFVLGA